MGAWANALAQAMLIERHATRQQAVWQVNIAAPRRKYRAKERTEDTRDNQIYNSYSMQPQILLCGSCHFISSASLSFTAVPQISYPLATGWRLSVRNVSGRKTPLSSRNFAPMSM